MPTIQAQNVRTDRSLNRERQKITLSTIRKSMRATARGKERQSIPSGPVSTELEIYLNLATFDLSLRLDVVEQYLKDESQTRPVPPEILRHFSEMLKEMRLCSEIGNFALGQIAARN